jgi:putative Holliday junction resolvase
MLIQRTGLEVILWDERLTTVAADELMAAQNIPRQERWRYVDQVAAMIILQDYLNDLSRERKENL